MNNSKKQAGVGLIEVLVALLLIAIGVLGFSALQLRAMDAANEAADRTLAINIARDLAERMRVNKTELGQYKISINAMKTSETGCVGRLSGYIPNCNAKKMADYDASEINIKAKDIGHLLRIDACKGSTLNCIYVAWGDTDIKSSTDQCVTSSGSYVANAQCLVMEAY
ncbi:MULTISPECIES: type IV pilus modification protein PilV [Acinetobacter]|uniref:type IV pilus modification protein PilV n=1 Tax=Acinetobacter TaxID=469 RepID=UPI000C235E7D|nr:MULTISPECIES: type IV pilus modification protein PilV [Acinetobacter]MBU3846036.1 type IV pilus modification protein PilV [Candidatus Acinetobacter avistercoris]MCP0911167.1 type IV pilus modification protein PilV [Acinetobacter pseudolwoffii]PJI30254.1 type IV pilus modification protein PilV [Acinetobacter pseudolwoffii]